MKKQLPMCLMAVCLCIVWTPVSARAYDYRDDILAQDANAEAYYGMEDDILDALSSTGTVRFDRAVRVYRFDWQDLVQALEGDFEALTAKTGQPVWMVPVDMGDGFAAAVIRESGFTTEQYQAPPASDTHLFDPEAVEILLAGTDFTSVYLTALPAAPWTTTVVVAVDADGTVSAVPFAARPEFMPFENGRWYVGPELAELLSAYASAQGLAAPSTPGRAIPLALGVAGGAVACAAAVTVVLALGRARSGVQRR